MFSGPTIIKSDGATGAKGASKDNVMGMVFGGVAVASLYPTLGVSKKLIQASDADLYGFNSAYDSANKVLVRYHIDEFFELNPEGVLWIMVVPQATTMAQMCDKTLLFVNKLIGDSGNTIRSFGVVRNPATGYTPTITNGIDVDVTNAVLKAQELADDWKVKNIYIDNAVIEGRELSTTASSWKDLRTMASPNVHVAVLQDKDVANLDALYAKTAAVGTVLGGIGVRRCEEDLGSINAEGNPNKGAENFPINNAAKGRWLNPAISSGVLTKDLTSTEVKALKDKAFIFADSYPEYPGVYFSGSPACTDATSDYAYGVATRVWNKTARKAAYKLVPKFNSTVDTAGGKIKASTIAGWEADVNTGKDGISTMVSEGHATNAALTIDPNQDVLATSKVIVKMSVTPYGYARAIEGYLGFSKS